MDDGHLVSVMEHKKVTIGINEDSVRSDQIPSGDGQVEPVTSVVSSSDEWSLQLRGLAGQQRVMEGGLFPYS